MTDVIEALDEYMDGLFTDHGCKAYGLAELVKKGAGVSPVHVDTRAQIAINDKYDVQWYHRILSSGSGASEGDSFGDKVAREHKVRIRTVFASKHKKGETIRYDFANALPESIEVDGYRRVDLDENVTMIEDQASVYEQEFGAADYEKHILAWNIVAMEYDIPFIKCRPVPCVSPPTWNVAVGLGNSSGAAVSAYNSPQNRTTVFYTGSNAFEPGQILYTNEKMTAPVTNSRLFDSRTANGYWEVNPVTGALIQFQTA